MEYRKK